MMWFVESTVRIDLVLSVARKYAISTENGRIHCFFYSGSIQLNTEKWKKKKKQQILVLTNTFHRNLALHFNFDLDFLSTNQAHAVSSFLLKKQYCRCADSKHPFHEAAVWWNGR